MKKIFIGFVLVFICFIISGCEGRLEEDNLEELLVDLFTVNDYSLLEYDPEDLAFQEQSDEMIIPKPQRKVIEKYQSRFTEECFEGFMSSAYGTVFTSLAQAGDYLISVQEINIKPTQDQPSSYDFEVILNLKNSDGISDTSTQVGFARYETSGKIEYFRLTTASFNAL